MQQSTAKLRYSLVFVALLVPSIGTAQITEIIDSTGDGIGNGLESPTDIAVDGSGNTFVAGLFSLNAFMIEPAGSVAEIIDESVGWLGLPDPAGPRHIAVDPSGDVYVSSAFQVFKITDPGGAGTVSPVLTSSTLSVSSITAFAADDSGAIYVGSNFPDSVFKVTDPGQATQAISTIIGPMGDGMGNLMQDAQGIAIDANGTVYVAAARNGQPLDDIVFMITLEGAITKILDAAGDGMGNPLQFATGVAVDASGNNVYVTGRSSNNVFRITDPGGANTVTEVLNGDSHPVVSPDSIAVDGSGNVYVGCASSSNAFTIAPGGVISEIIDATGDGENPLSSVSGIAVDGAGNVYASAVGTDNAFKIEAPECFLVIGNAPGNATFFDINHLFLTQVDSVEAAHPVLLDDIPEFVLPDGPSFAHHPLGPLDEMAVWMADGHFAVQVLMWNPQVFPLQPEQYTAGLHVTILPGGRVLATPYGTNLGGMEISYEIDVSAKGQKVIRFPFTIPGF